MTNDSLQSTVSGSTYANDSLDSELLRTILERSGTRWQLHLFVTKDVVVSRRSATNYKDYRRRWHQQSGPATTMFKFGGGLVPS